MQFGRKIMIAAIATTAIAGLAPARPRVMTHAEMIRMNPIIAPPPKRRRKSPAAVAALEAAAAKRARKRARNLAIAARSGIAA